MRKERGKGNIAGLAALLLFGVFAVCILFVLLTGADTYQRLAERDQSAYSQRTVAQYIATRVRQADGLDQVSVSDFGGLDALVLTEEIGGELYQTRVYCYGGTIRELFTLDVDGFAPEDGEKILPAEGLDLTLDGQVLTVVITNADGTVQELTLYLRSGEGVAP